MKFKIRITREIIDNAKCRRMDKCAFATAYNELVPHVLIGPVSGARFFDRDPHLDTCIQLATANISDSMIDFIIQFDEAETVAQKAAIPEQEFEVEIPDVVIDYWYKDTSELAQKITNNKILEPIQ